MMKTLKVAIDARLPDTGQGGVQQVINTLSSGFSELQDKSIDRCWLVLKGSTWWKNSLPPADELIEVEPPFGKMSLIVANRFPRLVSLLFPLVTRFFGEQVPYDKLLQSRGVDVVHLPFQDGFNTKLPVVYHPHDLQHHYFPENFNGVQIKHRETVWKAKALGAKVVMAASPFVVADLKNFWQIPNDAIQMIPIPPPERTVTNESILTDLPEHFVLYPAAFWSHKNHKNLLRAIAVLQESGIRIPVVLVGAQVGAYAEIKKLIEDLDLLNHVSILGHVSNSELTSLIQNAQVVVVPSLFEAMSLTVWDAQKLGTVVACSSIAPFPCQVGDTALLFDAHDPRSIADALSRLWIDEQLRIDFCEAAKKRTAGLTAVNYAQALIGVYQHVSGIKPTEASDRAKQSLINSICSTPI
jgi:glycosyltransferase involved in cell wall biosynthesis